MKLLKKVVVSFVALCMAVILPASLNTQKVAAAEDAKMSIFSIDAGRKYFSKDQLKQIVQKAHDNGYTHVQLLLGNDGLRFALDDMTIVTETKTYASDDVKAGITAGNDAYYKDPNGDYLTEAEMDEIIALAEKLNISIIPVINSPGHMDAILGAMEYVGIENPQYSYGGKQSTRTIDLNNKEALAFNKQLLTKYVEYFSKHSTIFNFGCDEYANDIDSSNEGYYNGWSRLQGTGMYPKFVAYVNDIAKLIKDNGMSPMAFNDGIYYGKKYNEEFGKFDTDIIISYWTSGWWGFYVDSANDLYNRGHKIVNTNDGWYWVLGHVEDGGYNYVNAIKNAETKEFTQIVGDQANTPSIGSTQAVWCDEPNMEHDMDRIMTLMDTFSEKHADIMIRPADYTAVDEALDSVPADLDKYTEASVEALNEAINAVDRTLKVTDQEAVDAMAKAIVDAVAALEVKPVTPEVKPEVKPEVPSKPATKPETKPNQTIKPEENPGTGDSSNLYLFATALIASLGFMGYAFKKRMN